MNIQEQNFFLTLMLQKNQEILVLRQEIKRLQEILKNQKQNVPALDERPEGE